MSQKSRVYSQSSLVLSKCSQRDNCLTKEEEKDIRSYYLSVIDDEYVFFSDKMKRFETEVMKDYGDLMKYKVADDKSIRFYRPESVILSKLSNKNVLSVGQHPMNDIVIDNPMVSRIHCFIFIYQDTIVVLDCWSLNGTNCVTAKNEIIQTKFNNRTIITLPRNEIFALIISNQPIIFNIDLSNGIPSSFGINILEQSWINKIRQIELICGHITYSSSAFGVYEGFCPECNLPVIGFASDLASIDKIDNCDNLFSRPRPISIRSTSTKSIHKRSASVLNISLPKIQSRFESSNTIKDNQPRKRIKLHLE